MTKKNLIIVLIILSSISAFGCSSETVESQEEINTAAWFNSFGEGLESFAFLKYNVDLSKLGKVVKTESYLRSPYITVHWKWIRNVPIPKRTQLVFISGTATIAVELLLSLSPNFDGCVRVITVGAPQTEYNSAVVCVRK